MTADCVTLWIGDSLGPVERACLRSVMRQGHSVALYRYGRLDGVPEGVEIRDAEAIVPHDVLTAPWCNRPDLYSDWFRYELLQRGLGTWLDTDVYLVAPLDMEKPYLFGYEEPGVLNNAIFRLPPDSPLLPRFLAPFHKRTVPRYMPMREYLRRKLVQIVTGHLDLTDIEWGTTSPWALTALANKFGIKHLAEPIERFYPVPWQEAKWILDPAIALEDVIAEGTVAVHLWNKFIQDFKNEPAPAGSFLHRLHEEARP